ncbi:MAG: nicotinate-nucleotide adenylyltransferase [Alphaproteobacteria bacterium]|nr:MAG: nicotinate-nucleotide adenylyltransferase [Alphaproteobacteria bacterium]
MDVRRFIAGACPRNAGPPRGHPLVPASARWRGLRIGLLGGSFNPAHDGHLHISREALKRLALHHVWWLVSPQNPLKPRAGMAPLAERLATARAVARHPRIHVSALEARLGTVYTVDTMARLRAAVPGAEFVWLMGADNLSQLVKWRRWRELAALVPLAVIDRDRYAFKGLAGKFAQCFRHHRLPQGAWKALATTPTPAWTFIGLRRHPISATALREERLRAASCRGRARALRVEE